jgi:hypothetical protein
MALLPDLVTRPAAVRTVSMKARPLAAGLGPGGEPPGPDAGGDPEPSSAREAATRSRARDRAQAVRYAYQHGLIVPVEWSRGQREVTWFALSPGPVGWMVAL